MLKKVNLEKLNGRTQGEVLSDMLNQLISRSLSLDTATRPRGHSRQVSAASVSIRQLKDQIIGRS